MGASLHDTIVAVSTPPGVGAVALVRLSGPGAGAVLARVAPSLGSELRPRRPTLALIVHPESGEAIDRALVTSFPGPASYTGEDVVEISGHGGRLVPRLVEEACRAAGARAATPGEFTRRAYLAGKVDLLQAEAVADLVESRSRALHRAALRQLDGGLSARVSRLRQGLIELEALLVHHLDFPEEDDAPVPLARVVTRARSLAREMEALEATAPEGELLRSGALVVLAGRPNTGKSSLFNALLGEERALVTDVPGTTRDALEAEVALGGFPFRLVDTAGLHEAGERIERLGIEVARRYLRAADAVLFCAEAGRPLAEDERAFLDGEVRPDVPVVLVRTKADEQPPSGARGTTRGEIPVSVRTGRGLDAVRDRLPRLVYAGLLRVTEEAPVVTRERHARALRRGRDEVEAFAGALEEGVPAEVAGAHLRGAESALEDVLGVLSPDEVLDHLFRSFCIGK